MKKSRTAATIASLIICLSAAGCASVSQSKNTEAADSSVSQAADGSDKTADNGSQSAKNKTEKNGATAVTASAAKIDTSDLFSKRDLKQEADLADAKEITVKDGETIDITEEGVYVIKGSAKNCTIKVTADKEAKVQLVLDGVTIENEDFPAIYAVSADKCFITVTDSENKLSVTGTFKSDGDTNTDAVIFSKDDIVFNGTGSLSITSSTGNGISGKDDIKFTGGTYSITSEKDAIEAHDSIRVCGGTFNINTKKDGLHSEDDDDDTTGWIYISDGTFNISASSDGIRGTTYTQIDGGSLTIKSSEGIESTYIQINGGTISISASDDGINASQKSRSAGTPTFEMNGGSLTVKMSGADVDCIDANGNVIVAGGTIDLTYTKNGPSESFDYDNQASFTGGTIIINGEQVSEIPTPMMMGGGMGGKSGGNGRMNMPGNFDPNNLPEGFDKDQMPGNFDPNNLPEGFDKDQMPGNFDPNNLPEGFDKDKMPGNFDPNNLPEDFRKGGFGKQDGDTGTDGQTRQRKRTRQDTAQDSLLATNA